MLFYNLAQIMSSYNLGQIIMSSYNLGQIIMSSYNLGQVIMVFLQFSPHHMSLQFRPRHTVFFHLCQVIASS